MQLPPASVLATLPPPNYINPETRGNAKVIINIVLYSILICFIGLRIFTRTHLRKFFGKDDVLILVALVFPRSAPNLCYMDILIDILN